MSRLHKVLSRSNSQINTSGKVPTYGADGKVLNTHKTRNTVLGIILLFFTALIIFLYVPGIFMKDKKKEAEKYAVQPDPSMIAVKNTNYSTTGSEDYDGDGLDTVAEEKNKCDPWSIDTDGDGADDCYEIYISKTDPTKYETEVAIALQQEKDKEENCAVNTPYQCGNVILWADDYESKALGGVVETSKGYRFTNFKGYAQFPHEGTIYAYSADNGKHKLLSHLENEDAWKIDGCSNVEITTEPLEEVIDFHIFNKQFYAKPNAFSKFFRFILPKKGFITADTLTRNDVEPDTSKATKATNFKFDYDPQDGSRFSKNTTSLANLQFVRSMIDNDRCVMVSLLDFNDGEVRGVIYGYTSDNDLLVADEDGHEIGIIRIYEKGRKMISGNGNQYLYTYFDWEGLGFSSASLDNISFFAVATPEQTNIVPEEKPTEEVTEAPTEAPTEKTTEAATEKPKGSGVDVKTGKWKQDEKGWYFEDANGVYAKNETLVIKGKTYKFNKKGYWIDENKTENPEKQKETTETTEKKKETSTEKATEKPTPSKKKSNKKTTETKKTNKSTQKTNKSK